ncbi:hypothetical protein [Escherichia coli]|nr:hypothetical protein [Escherichia coli O157]MED6826955.1 hypothetical protein [Escherichia coli O157]MED6924699.1 hypothetical protein [Escherichia coli O157]
MKAANNTKKATNPLAGWKLDLSDEVVCTNRNVVEAEKKLRKENK